MQELSSGKWNRAEKAGDFLVRLSAILFAVAIPTSIALDNVAAGIGIVGLILLALTRALPLPPLKPLFILLLTEIPHYITEPRKILKSTDLKQYLAAYFVGFRTGLDKEFLRKVILILGISTTALVLSVIFEALTGQNIKHINFSNLHLVKGLFRPKGFLNHPLTTGGVLYTLFFLFGALYAYFKDRKFLTISLITLLGLILNQSRSYWLGTFLFIAVFLIGTLKVKSYRKLAITGFLFISCLSAFLASYAPLKKRLESITDVKHNGSNKDRLTIWLSYYHSFKEDYGISLLYGKGEKATEFAIRHGKKACLTFYPKRYCQGNNYLYRLHGGETHNIYLKFLSKYGIIGLIAYLFFWGYSIYRNVAFYLKEGELFPLIFASGYIGFLTAGFFENNFTDAEVLTAVLFTLGVNFALLSLRSGGKPPHQRAD
jgi:O-antigen ligase